MLVHASKVKTTRKQKQELKMVSDDFLAAALSAITKAKITATKEQADNASPSSVPGHLLQYGVAVDLSSLFSTQLMKGEVRCVSSKAELGQGDPIFIQMLTGKTIILDFNETDTVADIKVKVHNKEGITPEEQILFFGQRLQDYRTLKDYGITPNSKIELLLKLRGGGGPAALHLSPNLRDERFDYDFTDVKDTLEYSRGKHRYHRPCGWMRIALKVLDRYDNDNVWLGINRKIVTDSAEGEWPVSYHGTGRHNLRSIAEDGYLLSKGKRFEFGHGVYSTPDIDVAERYATRFNFNGKNYVAVFQNRVNSDDTWVIPSAEVGGIGDYWITRNEKSIRPYGICIKEV